MNPLDAAILLGFAAWALAAGLRSRREAARGLEDLARFHARFEAPAARDAVAPWLRDPDRGPGSAATSGLMRMVLDANHEKLSPAYRAVGELYVEHRAWFHELWSAGPPTFVHGEKQGVPLAAALKQAVKHAKVTAESHIRTPENADYTLASGASDLVSIVRGQIADPHWVNKTREGRHEDIRGCISCNQMCWGRRSRDYWISCLINPSAGREFEWGGDRFGTTDQPKKVLVVGGGPAGMEAARVAAERGHVVTLAEALGDLGGQFRLAGIAPRRGQITELIGWYLRQFETLGVDVQYFTPMDADDIVEFGADAVVLATGSLPDAAARQRWLPEAEQLPGLEHGRVFACEDVFREQVELGRAVIVIDEGGNWRGTGTAWHLADKGHAVTIVTPDPMIGKELTRTTSDFQIRAALKKLGVRFMLESVVAQWHGDRAEIRCLLDGGSEEIEAAAIVTATTNRVDNDTELTLAAAGVELHVIGDAAAPRQAPYAFHDGRKTGLVL